MKLGDICNILNGRNQKKVEDINGKYPIYGSGGIMGYANDYICKAGTTIIGRKGSINKPLYVDKDFWNVDTAFGLQPKECCNSRFLYYLCKSIDFTRYDKGVTIPSLVKSDLLQIPVSVPPLSEQYRIVEELDQLSNIIEKKRQQLSELDNLAQSIFYDMFGDPVTNEKGWEVKKLENVVSKDCPISYGIVQPGENVIDGIPIVRPVDLTDTFVRLNELKKTNNEISNAYKRTILRGDELLICVRGTTGLSALATKDLKGCNVTRGIVPLFFDENNRWFIYLLLKQKSMLKIIRDLTYGIALKQINIKELRALPIPLPPLSLQQLFAQKIEAIEKEKELIKQSIKETEDLFNSRMDYYFG